MAKKLNDVRNDLIVERSVELMDVTPMNGCVTIRMEPVEDKIILMDNKQKEKMAKLFVAALGKGAEKETEAKVGDQVMINHQAIIGSYAGDNIPIEDRRMILDAKGIIAVLTPKVESMKMVS